VGKGKETKQLGEEVNGLRAKGQRKEAEDQREGPDFF